MKSLERKERERVKWTDFQYDGHSEFLQVHYRHPIIIGQTCVLAQLYNILLRITCDIIQHQ